jgi:ribonuclease P protein component
MRHQGGHTGERDGDRSPANASRFGAGDRLHQSVEFLTLQRRGIRHQTPHFVLYAGRLGDGTAERSRLGVTVSRRVGNAVVRNRIKRHVRECFRRKLREQMPAGASLVVIARAGAGELKSPSINAELLTATLSLGRKLGGGERK